jgi:hypothetical protein
MAFLLGRRNKAICRNAQRNLSRSLARRSRHGSGVVLAALDAGRAGGLLNSGRRARLSGLALKSLVRVGNETESEG